VTARNGIEAACVDRYSCHAIPRPDRW
jgi:hypothetical protein